MGSKLFIFILSIMYYIPYSWNGHSSLRTSNTCSNNKKLHKNQIVWWDCNSKCTCSLWFNCDTNLYTVCTVYRIAPLCYAARILISLQKLYMDNVCNRHFLIQITADVSQRVLKALYSRSCVPCIHASLFVKCSYSTGVVY